jgi:hypothetical protein
MRARVRGARRVGRIRGAPVKRRIRQTAVELDGSAWPGADPAGCARRESLPGAADRPGAETRGPAAKTAMPADRRRSRDRVARPRSLHRSEFRAGPHAAPARLRAGGRASPRPRGGSRVARPAVRARWVSGSVSRLDLQTISGTANDALRRTTSRPRPPCVWCRETSSRFRFQRASVGFAGLSGRASEDSRTALTFFRRSLRTPSRSRSVSAPKAGGDLAACPQPPLELRTDTLDTRHRCKDRGRAIRSRLRVRSAGIAVLAAGSSAPAPGRYAPPGSDPAARTAGEVAPRLRDHASVLNADPLLELRAK